MQQISEFETKGTSSHFQRPNQSVVRRTTLPSISHIIEGKALDLRVVERLDEDKESSSEEEQETSRINQEKDVSGYRVSQSKQKHSRGRITDRAPKLEDELKQQGEKFEKQQSASREELRQLEMSLESEKAKCSLLEEMLDKERADRLKVEKEVEVLKATSPWTNSRAGTEAST